MLCKKGVEGSLRIVCMPKCACYSYKQHAQCLKHMTFTMLDLLVHYGFPGSRPVSDPKLDPLTLKAC